MKWRGILVFLTCLTIFGLIGFSTFNTSPSPPCEGCEEEVLSSLTLRPVVSVPSTTPERRVKGNASHSSTVVRSEVGKTAVTLPILEQLTIVERSAARVDNFHYQQYVPRGRMNASRNIRPHFLSFEESQATYQIPVPETCPSSLRPDEFCTPNLGRDWDVTSRVFPLSYSLPEELFVEQAPRKDRDCAEIVPRRRSTYKFATEKEYRLEYSRSLYCITYKKGGWDALRHYEIIAAGCMPYFVDLEFSPVYTMYHLPKKLILEAMRLPGVHFDCAAITIRIDHDAFPRQEYNRLLSELLTHARKYLTTKAMARYLLRAVGKPNAKKVLYLAKRFKNSPMRAQGNYNSWTLFHGMRSLLGAGAVDPDVLPFLYNTSEAAKRKMAGNLYGMGFGYAFMLPNIDVNRSLVFERVREREFDLVIIADPTSFATKDGQLKHAAYIRRFYSKTEVLLLHAPDVAYGDSRHYGYTPQTLYATGTVFQREIMDCEWYVPSDRIGEAMKRCVWYDNKNCFDDANVQKMVKERKLLETGGGGTKELGYVVSWKRFPITNKNSSST